MHCSDKHVHSIASLQIGARASPLSIVQVKEVLTSLHQYHPNVVSQVHYMTTIGDRDQSTSLRHLGRTDFFTRDIDQWVLQGVGRVGIHSAKDLPQDLMPGLAIFCLTHGLDASDAIVLRPQDTFYNLPSGALIATSSLRREENVRQLRPDLTFCDLRGTIEQRLTRLFKYEVDGIVVAEAALIRLGLTDCNRFALPGVTAIGQGQLSVVGRNEEHDMRNIFSCLDVRLHASYIACHK